MSLAIRTVLRPVVWSDVDSRGHTLRRPRSPSCDPPSSAPAPPGAPGQQQQQQQYPPDATGYPPRKKLKQYGSTSALYYPPALSPSEKLWRDRYTYLLQRGYQLRPRYSPNWTPTAFGNGRHHHSGEDHIMQIVSVFRLFCLSWHLIFLPSSPSLLMPSYPNPMLPPLRRSSPKSSTASGAKTASSSASR